MSHQDEVHDHSPKQADSFQFLTELEPRGESIEKLALFFKALGTPSRLGIVAALYKQESHGCDLSEVLDLSKSSISHQMKILIESQIVSFKKEGKHTRYFLSDDHIRELFRNAYEHIIEEESKA